MSESGCQLKVVFDKSLNDPFISGITWQGDRQSPDIKNVGKAKPRLRALGILFLLTKYQEHLQDRFVKLVHATRRQILTPEQQKLLPAYVRLPDFPNQEIRFASFLRSGTWIHTLANSQTKANDRSKSEALDFWKWMVAFFNIPKEQMFFSVEFGSAHKIKGNKKPATVTYLPTALALSDLIVHENHPKNGITIISEERLLELALEIEGAFYPVSAIAQLPPYFALKGGSEQLVQVAEAFVRAEIEGFDSIPFQVREYLAHLAKNGLEKHVLFPPHALNGKPLIERCVEPRFTSESQYLNYIACNAQSPEKEEIFELFGENTIRDPFPFSTMKLKEIADKSSQDSNHMRILIRGNAGEGKTTALWLHVAERCTDLISMSLSNGSIVDLAEFKVPLIVHLGEILPSKKSLIKLAIERTLEISFGSMKKPQAKYLEGWLNEKVTRGEYFLMLDAIDELTSTSSQHSRLWLRDRMQEIPENVLLIVASRPLAAGSDAGMTMNQATVNFQAYRLICLDQPQIERFVTSYFGENEAKAKRLLRALNHNPGPNHLSRLPLLLSVFCYIGNDSLTPATTPSTRSQLIGIAIRCLFGIGSQKDQCTTEMLTMNALRKTS